MTSPTIPRNISLEEMDKQSLLHPYTSLAQHLNHGPIVITEGHAARVTDNKGRDYLDAMGGLWCVNIGYGRQEMVDAITEQANKIAYYHLFFSMANEPAIRLADEVLAIAPNHMSKVFFCNSGSEANDTQANANSCNGSRWSNYTTRRVLHRNPKGLKEARCLVHC